MNILTFDIEEWYLEKVLHGGRESKYKQYDEIFHRILDDLDRLDIKATFFCVGKLAIEFPNVVVEIAKRGHEVGCHSNEHTWLNRMTEEQLRRDTLEAIKALEDVSGQKVVSYRAPAFSVTNDNKWAVSVLAECGIENDSSIFPTDRDLGGYRGFPQDTPCLISYKGSVLKEYPIGLTTFFGKPTAYSGGGYFRVLPYGFIAKTMNKRSYNVCYFHLNDLIQEKKAMKSKAEYEEYYKERGSLKNRLIRYIKSNIGNGDIYGKLHKLLGSTSFTSIRDAGVDWASVQTINL